MGFPGGAGGREPACQCRRREMHVRSLGREDPLEEEDLTSHSSVLAWRISWTEEPRALLAHSPRGHEGSDTTGGAEHAGGTRVRLGRRGETPQTGADTAGACLLTLLEAGSPRSRCCQVSPGASLLGLPMATFLLNPHVVLPLSTHTPVVCVPMWGVPRVLLY